MTILTSLIVLGITGLIAGVVLTISYSRLKVEEDPGVEEIMEKLPGLNCGACGYASCHEYALGVAAGSADVSLCRAGGPELSAELASLTGVEGPPEGPPVKAVVLCGVKDRKMNAEYRGSKSCLSADITGGGGMACRYGCLGYGDCVKACPLGGVRLNPAGVPEIADEKCTGCGLCAGACPRDIIKVLPVAKDSKLIYVACSNTQSGKNTRKVCPDGCIACMLCVKKGPEGVFEVKDNLARALPRENGADISSLKCPTSCIYEKKIQGNR